MTHEEIAFKYKCLHAAVYSMREKQKASGGLRGLPGLMSAQALEKIVDRLLEEE